MSNSLLVLAAILSCTRLDCSAWADDKPNPLFTISKETTYFTGPLTKDGTVDYATAINRRLSRGVTPENNAAVLFYRATGRVEQPEGFFRILGVPVPRPEGDYFLNLNEFLEQKYKIGLHDKRYKQQSAQLKKHQESASSRPWVGKQHPRIFEWLKRNEKAPGATGFASVFLRMQGNAMKADDFKKT